jgi:hypothetical protein
LALVVYGPPKVGKTSFSAEFPDPAFVNVEEEGLEDLQSYGKCVNARLYSSPGDWEKLLESLVSIAKQKQLPKTLVVDALSGVQRVCFVACCRRYFKDNWDEFMAYSKGPRTVGLKMFQEFVFRLRDLRSHGVNVVLIGHSKPTIEEDPIGGNYRKFVMDLDAAVWGVVHKWAQAVVFMRKDPQLDKSAGRQAKVKSYDRLLYVEGSPAFDAGNRMGLTQPIFLGDSPEAGYKAFIKALGG